ncbi:MAG: NUDIX hydrolase [Methylococcales bacterium]
MKTTNLIKILLDNIPRYAEEEGAFYSVPRELLINTLCTQQYINYAVAENTVGLLENLLDSLAVLNAEYLAKGEWCFISFPAQLIAMSVLTAMSDNESQFFEANFWNTQGIIDIKKEQQRDVLHTIESNRVMYHTSANAQPIRYIYVAWSIIKLDNLILFHQREDKKRHDKKSGDYVLIGGRLNQTDMDLADKKQCLPLLQSNQVDAIKPALFKTLQRELFEEAGLIYETHYNFSCWRELKPYKQLEGSAPNHALTEYYFSLFQINLTLEGYFFLTQQIKNSDRFLFWFSVDEVINKQSNDGKLLYINALLADYDKPADLKADLLALPESFINRYYFENRDKYTIKLSQNKPLYVGSSGKEKPLAVDLTERQAGLLLALAAHNRGFKFSSLVDGVVLQPFAWIEVNDLLLQNELIVLASLFKNTEFIIENKQDYLFRFSVYPDLLFFDDELFTYSVRQKDLDSIKTKTPINLMRAAISTPMGVCASKTEDFLLSFDLAMGLHELSQTSYTATHYEAMKIKDNCRKFFDKNESFLALGLKNLLREEAGMIKFCAVYSLA